MNSLLLLSLGLLVLVGLIYFGKIDRMVSCQQKQRRLLSNFVFAIILIDGAITSIGQPSIYWQGAFW